MAKADSKEMDALHAQLAITLRDEIDSFKEPIEVADEDGTVTKVSRDRKGLAALLNVARQFLKDNNVTALAVPDSPTANLAKGLPFLGTEFSPDDEEDSPIH